MSRLILQSDDICAGCGCELPRGSNVFMDGFGQVFCEECEKLRKIKSKANTDSL